jgi:hypothetical protein
MQRISVNGLGTGQFGKILQSLLNCITDLAELRIAAIFSYVQDGSEGKVT